MNSESLALTDAQSAAVAIAPRVSLADIEGAIAARFEFTADKLGSVANHHWAADVEVPAVVEQLGILSVCILVMRNGFTIIGKSAPASPENFNAELGRKYAYEDAVRQLWPLMGFALRDRLASSPDARLRLPDASGSYCGTGSPYPLARP